MHLLDQIPLVTRGVTDDGDTVGVTLSRTYDASDVDLWEALTDPSRLEHWFEPVSGDLRAGGTVRCAGGVTGEILTCTPEQLLRLAWDDGTPGTLELVLSPAERGTRLTLTHTVPRDEHWDTYGPAVNGIGWDSSLAALALHLAMDADAAEGEEETFIRRLAAEWSGVDTQQAQRTIDLYLGE
ncbi:MAG: polyketide cyclase [Corynebacterium humireducens]|uniref:Polyketide cyclase n=1 Tax=Corynebacterium humireducens TaxID=1223514 RepID=A0A7X6PP32_9CORY|nr:polyketide cyclase [Corynebacterium humireducens]